MVQTITKAVTEHEELIVDEEHSLRPHEHDKALAVRTVTVQVTAQVTAMEGRQMSGNRWLVARLNEARLIVAVAVILPVIVVDVVAVIVAVGVVTVVLAHTVRVEREVQHLILTTHRK